MSKPANGPEEFCAFCDTFKLNVKLIPIAGKAICIECLKLLNDFVEATDPVTKPYVGGEHAPMLPAAVTHELLYHATDVMLNALALGGEPQPYSIVAPLAGFHHRDRNFYALLGRSVREDHAAGKPLRASLVINKTRLLPGPAYFEVCRQLGYTVPTSPKGEQVFWQQQIQRLHDAAA